MELASHEANCCYAKRSNMVLPVVHTARLSSPFDLLSVFSPSSIRHAYIIGLIRYHLGFSRISLRSSSSHDRTHRLHSFTAPVEALCIAACSSPRRSEYTEDHLVSTSFIHIMIRFFADRALPSLGQHGGREHESARAIGAYTWDYWVVFSLS